MTVLITALLFPTPSTPTVIKNTAVQAKCSVMLYISLPSPLCAWCTVNPECQYNIKLLHSHDIVEICSRRIDIFFKRLLESLKMLRPFCPTFAF